MVAVPVAAERTPAELRALARRERDGRVSARLLALANALDGMSRDAAARAAGMDRQTLRDWVHRYNAEGLAGLRDRPRPGRPCGLDEGRQAALKGLVLKGPKLKRDGCVAWRARDLRELVERRFGVRLEPAAQVGTRPGGDTVPLRVGAAEHPRRQGRLLRLAQPRGSAGLGPVVQPGEPLGVVARHGVAQGLALHAGEPGGLGPARPLQGVGDRQHAQRGPPVRLASRVPAQRLRRQLVPDQQRRAHHPLPGRPSSVPTRRARRPL
jgi:transposase